MGQHIRIQQLIYASAEAWVTLPDGKEWSDVVDRSVSFDTIKIKFNDGSEFEEKLDSDVTGSAADTKRPVSVYVMNEDGEDIDQID